LKQVIYISFLLLTCLMCFSHCSKSANEKKDYNVIFISLDTTRHDHIDTGLGARAETPAIKRFSEHALVFERAFAPSSETLPSHLSAFTSRLPHELGVIGNGDGFDGRFPMIQEVLKQKQYTSYGVISLWALQEIGIRRRFDEFNLQLLREEKNHYVVKGDKITQAAINKLDSLKEHPFFMLVHFSDPHAPYSPPGEIGNFTFYVNKKIVSKFSPNTGILLKEVPLKAGSNRISFEIDDSFAHFKYFIIKDLPQQVRLKDKSPGIEVDTQLFGGSYLVKGQKTWLDVTVAKAKRVKIQVIPMLKSQPARAMYKKEVTFMDQQVGKFLDRVKAVGLMQKSIIVIFSDHGEGLGERDGFFGHVEYLNPQFIHVPLMIHIPGIKSRRIDEAVPLTGLSLTLLQYLGHVPKTTDSNHSFLPYLLGEASKPMRIHSFALKPSSNINKISVLQWPYQMIFSWDKKNQFSELYHLEKNDGFSCEDQISRNQLDKLGKKLYFRFYQEVVNFKKKLSSMKPSKRKIKKEKLEKLKGLGYLN
jgi:membrane-anchored protein YejM (alkaline phosphatase superfamily)